MIIINETKNTKIHFGDNLSQDLSFIIKSEGLIKQKVLLVTGLNSFDKSIWKSDFFKILDENNLTIEKHVKVAPNPSMKDVLEVASNENNFSLIICIGGGSVIDFCKLLKLKYYNKAKILAFYTIAGSGSIVTPFTVYDNNEFKIGEHSEDIIPDFVYVNKQIIDSLSFKKKISAVCDISAHGIESFLSKTSTTASRIWAIESFNILQKNIMDLENITAIDLIKADIYAALSESVGAVLFPHAVGHYLTYKFKIDHNIASVYCLDKYLQVLSDSGANVKDFKDYFDKLHILLNEHNLLPRLILRDDQLNDLMLLVKKYMGFVFDNSPIIIDNNKYLNILRSKNNFSNADVLENLNTTIKQAKRSKFYGDKLKNFSNNLLSLNDLRLLPFTTKSDLRSVYPSGALAVGFKEVIEMHTTSGTTGKPTLSFYNKKDLKLGAEAIAEAWANFGLDCNSRVQFIMSYGLFSGAMLNTYALQELGVFVLPSGIQPIEKQINLLIDFKIDTVVATPSYLLYLADYLEEHGLYRNKLKLVRAIAAGEIYSDATRKKIENKLGITVYDHYGLCEVNTGIAYECFEKNGLHVLDDYVIPEIIDPLTGLVLPDGEYGELVLTSLKKEASPIIRYRTGDITCIKRGECNCGSSRIRLDRIKNRIDDLLFIRGLKINPHELKESVISLVGENLHCGFMKIITKKNSIDFIPQILLFVKDGNSINVDDLRKRIKDKTQVNFDFQLVNYKNVNLFENTKLKLVEYVD